LKFLGNFADPMAETGTGTQTETKTQIQISWHELLVATYAEHKRLKAELARLQSELEEEMARSLFGAPVCSSRVKRSETLR
jgi:hypothetical protein